MVVWIIIVGGLALVLALTVLLRRRGARGPSGDDTWRDAGLTPESSRISPHNHGFGGL